MKLHEYQSKEIFKKYGIPVARGFVAFTTSEVAPQWKKMGFKTAMVKAQVLAGGRGKAGGILKASNLSEAERQTQALLGKTLKTAQSGAGGVPVRGVLIEECTAFTSEFYLAIALNRSSGGASLIFSESGGMDIEEVAHKTPQKVIKILLPPRPEADTAFFESRLKLSKKFSSLVQPLINTAACLHRLYEDNDCLLAEINPLAGTHDALVALDAKLLLDDNASFRHPAWSDLRDPDEEDRKETRAKQSGLSYVSLQGNIGCLVNGAGLAMATMDTIQNAGGQPANFLDVGGGATKEQVQEGFRIILEDPHVKALLVNIFGGIMQCDIIAQALIDAANEMNLKVPLVVRLEGTRVEEGRALLKGSSLTLHATTTMDEAAKKAVSLAQGQP